MMKYTKEELLAALRVVSSTISKCEKIQPKFAEGTSQHTLLRNRIKAMYISIALITEEHTRKYTAEELQQASPPIASIISKCEKAQVKFAEDSVHYSNFREMIVAMSISKFLVLHEINKRG
ncbi:hypothetical protein [Chitinophaga nivalis]|uniref:Four helix bundle protein n=1 Tax=Chitinophaga nivalis TaxID=2991709 RepID=A0ABT3IPM9_9BACT|nr:hypothetical protein [Chitinophaga nivalis]MCW3464383.1 hypothetical protein [Chitinophaga nivalis]MCW3485926.1 hypothetical protein [Chitinophaga nivalis]